MESYSVKAVLSAADKGFTGTIKGALGSLKGVESAASSAGTTIMKIASGIGVFKAVSAGVNLLKSSISSAFARQDTMEQFNRTITAITGSTDAAGSALDSLRNITKGTAYGLDVAAKATQDFVTRGMEIGSATRSVGAWSDAVAFYGKGTSAQLAEVTDAIAKMRTKGKVEMDQLNRLFDAGIDAVGMYAKAVGRDSASVQDGLSKVKISAEDFLETVETAMMEGTNGVQKIAGAAKEAGASWTGTFDNMQAAVTRGVLSIINSIDNMLETNGFPTMRETIKKFGDTAETVLNRVSALISELNLKGLVESVKPYWEILKNVAEEVVSAFGEAFTAVGNSLKKLYGQLDKTESLSTFSKVLEVLKTALQSVAGFIEDHADGFAKLISTLPKLIAAYAGFKVLKGILGPVVTFGASIVGLVKRLKGFSKDSAKTTTATEAIKNGFESLQKSAGIALVIASLAGLALAIKPLAELGITAVPPLLAFGAAVGGLAFILGSMGKKLQESMAGIAVFAVSVSAMALAMAPITAAGTEGAIAMGVFGLVVAGLASVFALFGNALNVAIPGMIAFGITILSVGAGLALASVFVSAFTSLIEQVGNTISQVSGAIASDISKITDSFVELVSGVSDAVSQIIDAIGNTLVNVIETAGGIIIQVVDALSKGFETISNGIATVVDAISGGLTKVLDAIAGIIQSIGESAKNAGTGFKSVAEGISMISDLSIVDIGKALGAVAIGIGEISGKGEGLQSVANGLEGISTAITGASAATTSFNGLLVQMSILSLAVVSSVSKISAAFTELKIPPIDAGPMLAALISISSGMQTMSGSIKASLLSMQSYYTSTYARIGGIVQSGASRIKNTVQGNIKQIESIVKSGINTVISNITMGISKFNNVVRGGMNKAVLETRSGAASIVTALNSAQSGAYNAGRYIGIGLANGMKSMLSTVRSVATQLAAAAEAAVIAKAKIGSPSKVFAELGGYIGEGFANGILGMVSAVRKAGFKLEDAVTITVPDFSDNLQYALAGEVKISVDAESYGNNYLAELRAIKEEIRSQNQKKYVLDATLNLEGRTAAKVLAPFTQSELEKLETRSNRKRGTR